MRKASLVLGAAAVAVLSSSAAHAQSFGDAGHLVISGNSDFALVRSTASVPPGGTPVPNTTSFVVSPGLDYFVVRGLSLGAVALYGHTQQDAVAATASQAGQASYHSDVLTLGPRVGYNIALSSDVSLWPSVFGTYGETWSSAGNGSALRAGASVPLLFHPAQHFFIGIGPFVTTEFATGAAPRYTDYGLNLTLGGWL